MLIQGMRFNDIINLIMKSLDQKLNTPEEELNFLSEKSKVEQMQSFLENNLKKESSIENKISEQIEKYRKTEPEKVISDKLKISEQDMDKIVLNLAPEQHDNLMEPLLGLLEEKGIKNALTAVSKMNNPHIEDDFHRLLVQYVKGGNIERLPQNLKNIPSELEMVLFEVILPEFENNEEKNDLTSLIAPMEQFYSGMISITSGKGGDYFTIEMAVADHSNDLVIYSSVPNDKQDLFKKHVLAIFPNAVVNEINNDFNIFRDDYIAKGSKAVLDKKPMFTLKTYEEFSNDPFGIMLNSFSKLSYEEGASIQLVINPEDKKINNKYKKVLDKVQKGISLQEATRSEMMGMAVGLGDAVFGAKKKKDDDKKEINVDQSIVENIQNKIASPIMSSNIRVVVSAQDETRANVILNEIESSFNQFENPTGNKFSFEKVEGNKLKKFLHKFSFRKYEKTEELFLNIKELSTLVHFSSAHIESSEILKQSKSTTAPASNKMSSDGVLLGINNHRGSQVEVKMNERDRLRHLYVVGQTGTGKTTLLKNMIVQDILNGEGVCMIDPHGSDIEDILGNIPEERYKDVIYFDPAYIERPFALNMLEYDITKPEQKTFVVDEMLSIFNKLFDMKTAGGPMFEQYFRQAVLLVIDHPESGNTLADISRVLSDKKFRDMKLSMCKNKNVVRFWKDVAEQAGGEASLQNIVPYITSKFDVFLSNEIMGPIVTQPKSSFDFREIMDNKKILLVNLSKGRLGEINSNLIGLIIVGKLLMASLSRVELEEDQRNPFYLYIDEFQNVTTDSISTILSEARKYKLSLNIAHQFIKQLDEGIRDSVFGNVGSIISFRVGQDDAEYLENQLSPVFDANDIANIDNRNAYVKMLINGQPSKPFNISTTAPKKGNPDTIQKLKELSYLRYGQDK